MYMFIRTVLNLVKSLPSTMLLPCRIIAKGRYAMILACFISFVVLLVYVVLHDKATEFTFEPIKQQKYRIFQNISQYPLRKCLKHMNISLVFSKLMHELDIEAVLIDPYALLCLMSANSKAQLKNKSFSILNYPPSEAVTRFALIGKNVEKLKKLQNKTFLKTRGFIYESVIDSVDDNSSIGRNHIAHHFFASFDQIIHAVVLRERGDYLWLKKIHYIPKFKSLKQEDFEFYKHDTAYERFSREFLKLTEGNILMVPEDPARFLFQLNSAKFLECDLSRARYLPKEAKKDEKAVELENGFVIALKEFKAHLQPLLKNFFLHGGTLLGWYRQCGIISYTTDVDFAVWASDAGSVDYWINTFQNYKKLKIISTMGLPEEAFELKFVNVGAYIDLFFVYKDGNMTWVSGHRPLKGYYLRYSYPMFSLCSADLLGYKVLVPCETLEVILADYGPSWDKPVTSWNFESSPKNMGQHIFWPDDKKDAVYRQL